MSSADFIRRYVRRSAWVVSALGAARGLMQMGLFLIPFFVALSLLDGFFDLTSAFRKSMWVMGVLAGLFFLVRGFWPFSIFRVKARSRFLSERGNRFREDDLEIAFNFSARRLEGTSEDLKDDFLDSVAARLRSSPVSACFPAFAWKKTAAIFVVLLVLLPVLPLSGRILFPYVSLRLRDFIEVRPGSVQIPFGSTARIETILKSPSADKPRLYVKGAADWAEVSPDVESAAMFAFDLKNVVRPLSYRVYWRGEWGEKYTLEPVTALTVEKFEIVINPPSYLGLESKTQTAPEISGLVGSGVRLQATLNRAVPQAELLLPEGEVVKMEVSGQQVTARFTLQKNGAYGFSFSQDRYPIQIRPDEPPTLTLLSPAEDLIVSAKDKLPVTYEAADDMGLGEINLIVETAPGQSETKRIQLFTSATPNTLATHEWDLSRYKPGDVFRFQLEAVDKNTVTGPGRVKSEWRLIEVASFEKSHESLAQILEAWRDKTLDLLGDVNTTRSALDKEAPAYPELNQSFSKAMQASLESEKMLEKIVSLMEKDPLADYGVWLEHKEMKDNLAKMNQSAMKQAQASLQTANKAEAARSLDSVSSELERMLALSEDLSKKQRASDVMEMAENLEKLGEDMVKQLEDNPNAAAINKMLEEAAALLQQMAKTIEKGPKDLPEDFVNQEALKDLKMDQAGDILSQIQQAMKQGDYKKAMELAKQYLDAAKKMAEQLSEAYESYTEENSAEQLADEIEKKMEKLGDIAKKQQELLAETQKVESERLKDMLEQQGKLLEQLYKEQMEAIRKAESLASEKGAHMQVRSAVTNELTLMNAVAEELKTKKIQRSLALLERIVLNLQNIEAVLSVSSAPVSGLSDMKDIREREKKIWDKLKNPELPQSGPSGAQKEKLSGLKGSQSALGKETQSLKKELQALSRKSASLSLSVTEPLSKAAESMDDAAKKLGEGDSKGAQSSEEKALEQLGAAGDALGNAQEMMGGMPNRSGPGGPGRGGGPRAIVRPGGSGGGRGIQTGKVRLPTVEDYKPPKEFREELLESLKEKYPKVYEEIIHKYYKRLTD